MTAKSLRLSQLAKECNAGVATITECLGELGMEGKLRPTTKIPGEYIQKVLEKFAPDKARKLESEEVSRQKTEEKELLRKEKQEEVEEEEPIQPAPEEIPEDKPRLSGPKFVGKIDLNAPQKSAKPVEEEEPEPETASEKLPEKEEQEEKETEATEPEQSTPESEPVKEETPEQPVEPEATEKPEAPQEEVEAKTVPEPEKPTEQQPEQQIEQQATVEKDVPQEKQEATTPAEKESKTEAEETKTDAIPEITAESKNPASPPKEEPAASETSKPTEEKKEEEKAPEKTEEKTEDNTEEKAPEKPNDGNIATKYTKLTGPKFTGEKVDLSKFERPKKKKVASSTDSKEDKKKRKRRRIHKPDGKPGGGNNAGKAGVRRGAPNKGKGREPKRELTEEEVQKQIKETLEKLTSGGKKSKGSKLRREKRMERREQQEEMEAQQEEQSKVIQVTEFVTVSDLASMMDTSVNDIISACMSLGMMVTMNQRLDGETLQIVAEEFGYTVEFVSADLTDPVQYEEDAEEDLKPRAPIVTVMGHVDHGKTSLLDYIRKANVIAGESGGITQHVGAYQVELENDQKITFLDTPGHEAFTAMRARGAKVTDVAIIVIAADDDVMPQTKEAISHAQAADVPIIFAINKVDLPNSNPAKIKESLARMNILVEEYGGKVQSHDISAKQGTGVKEIMEKVLLEAELLDLKANPDREATGTIIEASLDKGRGYVSNILVQNGTLKMGDYLLAGQYSGKVKALLDERGHRLEEAGPAAAVTILGLDGAPQAGDTFMVMQDEREAKNIATKRTQLQREQSARTQKNLTLEEIGRRLAIGDFQELNIIVKGDVDGSIEALADSLQKLSTEEIQVSIIHKAVGQISESDILLAAASDAIIVGFQVRPSANARKIAEKEHVDVRLYSIIYDAINEIKDAMEGMLSPDIKEEVICNIEVRETFKISKVGTIAGCYVLDGKIDRNSRIRLIRDGVVKYTGELGSLKRYKDDVKEVSKGYECGLNIKNYNDIKVGDIIEGFKEVEVKKTLSSS